jgi:type I restriction enzyme S subunit
MKTSEQQNSASSWDLVKFNEAVSGILDFRGRTPLKLGMTWGGSIPALSANNVKKGYIDFNSECHMASEELYTKWMSKGDLKKGDIIFTMEAPLGNVAIISDDKKYLLSQRVVAFRFHKNINCLFMYHYLLSDIFRGRLNLLSTGSTAKGVNQKSLSKINFLIPPLSEQNRIVEVLETWDKAIEKLTKKIEIKKQIKKGLMQELLTGKKRLNGFNEEWKYFQLEKIAKTSSGGTPKSDNTEYYSNGTIPWLTSGELRKGKISNFNKFITEKGLENSSAKIFPKNTVLVAMYGATAGQVGFLEEEASTNQAICGILPNEKYSSLFLYYYFTTKTECLLRMGTGAAQPNISQEILKILDINLPPLLVEQNRIVEILETSDKLIKELEKKLHLIKDQKKYLLNNLITGTIRTPETLSAPLTR